MKRELTEIVDEYSVSQGLLEAALSGNESAVSQALLSEHVDVNHKGTISLRFKRTDSIQQEDTPDEVKIEYEEFKTDVTPLFAAAHAGHISIAKRLLIAGADVNEKLFRGYATTAAAREGHHQIIDVMQRAGAAQPALEDALLEACLYNQVKSVEVLISSEMTRPEILAQALVHASNRGYLDIVATLTKACSRGEILAGGDCQCVTTDKFFLVNSNGKAGGKPDLKVSVGAWSWDYASGEELRVGAGLAEPYDGAWCAVEYWEVSGTILSMLMQYVSPNDEHNGRTLLCHAILCNNHQACTVLLSAGADAEYRIRTRSGQEYRPLHLAARLGYVSIVQLLIDHGCDLNIRTEYDETALMLSAKGGFENCFKSLLLSGADLGLLNEQGQSALELAELSGLTSSADFFLWDALRSGNRLHSSNPHVFSALHFVAKQGDVGVLRNLLRHPSIDSNAKDKHGYSAAMVAVQAGRLEVFEIFLQSGIDIGLVGSKGETVLSLVKSSDLRESFERIILNAVLANLLKGEDFHALHYAAQRGNLEALRQLLRNGCAIDTLNDEDCTPLMLSAREGHAEACRLLLLAGADCNLSNSQGETALSLARKSTFSKASEGVILDHMAIKLVLVGGQLYKHTRQGKGAPHLKIVRMLRTGLLTWGETRRRNVICKEAGIGPTRTFLRNCKKAGADKPGIFWVITSSGREVHFEASAAAIAELWVRGITGLIKKSVVTHTTHRQLASFSS
ncbi:hypothetical protein O6H91_20G000900 [Diphasiastrum complanatum]|uniref:Uncharacterized protein n=2 Tax=Diphasiastrum complanatum TaxID=34168 RepID=A0ACC2AM46_DIPCM|nr:hypothetical protein O6H91_20G000900 [Diphasiastrum complanatum]KAJ7518626.1 hypothetical protein O6H91_20G000900 [Diphasiastrum complanatum]